MTDRGGQDEVVVLTERVGQYVACPRGNTIRKPSFPDVLLRERKNIAAI
jgi:hypothetical protein